jgi:P27 family predicted phage terminase small subunit
MPGGRPPKPTQLKVLEGNPGKRKLNHNEPQFSADGLFCPRGLGPEARREWRRVAKLLREQRVVTAADRGALAAYCVSWARWMQAEAVVETEGLTVDVTLYNRKGEEIGTKPTINPNVMVAQQYQRLLMAAAGRLGLDPSSRSKVTTVKDPIAQNPILELLRGSKTGS